MNKLKKSEKSRGIVAFADNTPTTDYVSIAQKTLEIAGKTLDLPYTILSNGAQQIDNYRYDIDYLEFVKWNNLSRYKVFELSPYDETLVIDADYLVLDNKIKFIFETQWDYVLQRQSYALTQEWPETMGSYSLPFVWATVFAFRKTPRAKLFFNLVERIQNNYEYYHTLFNIRERNYRNDYAFAIADYIVNGYCLSNHSIPGNMLTVDQAIESIDFNDRNLIVKDQTRSYVLPRMNLHIISKKYLQSNNFDELIAKL